jgi:hypothetical protein
MGRAPAAHQCRGGARFAFVLALKRSEPAAALEDERDKGQGEEERDKDHGSSRKGIGRGRVKEQGDWGGSARGDWRGCVQGDLPWRLGFFF